MGICPFFHLLRAYPKMGTGICPFCPFAGYAIALFFSPWNKLNQSKSVRLLFTTMSTSNRSIEKYGFTTRYSPELYAFQKKISFINQDTS